MDESERPRDGGGGYKAEHPSRQANMSLSAMAARLIECAETSERRAKDGEDPGYNQWRGRSLRQAAAHVYEVCGLPHEAARALRGSDG